MERVKQRKEKQRDVIIKIINLCISYGENRIIKNLNFEIRRGELVSFVGPSGCGKTTTLLGIAGLIKPTSGKILMNGKEIKEPGPDRGIVYQDYALYPWRRVYENVTFGLDIKGIKQEQKEKLIHESLSLLKLLGHEKKYPSELSGGMKQRVGLARAIVNNPDILLLDEAFSALDQQTRYRLENEMHEIFKKLGKTVINATHLLDEAILMSDRIAVFSEGEIVETFDITLPRPRDMHSKPFIDLLKKVEASIREKSDLELFVEDLKLIEELKKGKGKK